jgi:hypothetical protein
MNQVRFRGYVVKIVLFMFFAILGIVFSKALGWNEVYDVLKAIIPLIVAACVAIWGYCYQSYLARSKDVRDLWHKSVKTFQFALQYTYKEEPSEREWSDILRDCSILIDEMRGVFLNFGSKNTQGTYPFDELKYIKIILERLGVDSPANTPDKRVIARRQMLELWKLFRRKYLLELERWQASHLDVFTEEGPVVFSFENDKATVEKEIEDANDVKADVESGSAAQKKTK